MIENLKTTLRQKKALTSTQESSDETNIDMVATDIDMFEQKRSEHENVHLNFMYLFIQIFSYPFHNLNLSLRATFSVLKDDDSDADEHLKFHGSRAASTQRRVSYLLYTCRKFSTIDCMSDLSHFS